MSVAQTRHIRIQYTWSFTMISWYRQLLSLIYGLGVMLIALWAIENGNGPWLILGVVGMSMLTLMLIFGVEIDHVQVNMNGFEVDFTDTNGSRRDDE